MKKNLTLPEMTLAYNHFKSKAAVVVSDEGVTSSKDYRYSFGCPYVTLYPLEFKSFDHFCNAIISTQNRIDDEIADAVYDAVEYYTKDYDYQFDEA